MIDQYFKDFLSELKETNRLLNLLVNQQGVGADDAISKLLTVKDFVNNYPAFTAGGLRFQIFNKDYNGLSASGALVTVGRKILIDSDKYLAWIKTNPKREIKCK